MDYHPYSPDEAQRISEQATKLITRREATVVLDVAASDATHREHGEALIATTDGSFVRAWVWVPATTTK